MKSKSTGSPTLDEYLAQELRLVAGELELQADHFKAKAQQLALEIVLAPDAQAVGSAKHRLLSDHLIRSETYRAAATLVGAKPKAQTKA